ncbi:hypothetical protein FJ365_04480 [Candidatus Dependentiae bacterium]|nr:hypothetical protein [Candidatus Dependentiae bacterium]
MEGNLHFCGEHNNSHWSIIRSATPSSSRQNRRFIANQLQTLLQSQAYACYLSLSREGAHMNHCHAIATALTIIASTCNQVATASDRQGLLARLFTTRTTYPPSPRRSAAEIAHYQLRERNTDYSAAFVNYEHSARRVLAANTIGEGAASTIYDTKAPLLADHLRILERLTTAISILPSADKTIVQTFLQERGIALVADKAATLVDLQMEGILTPTLEAELCALHRGKTEARRQSFRVHRKASELDEARTSHRSKKK